MDHAFEPPEKKKRGDSASTPPKIFALPPFQADSVISPEAAGLIATRCYSHEGLRKLGTLLPADDEELHRWLTSASDAKDEMSFQMLFSATALSGRKLPPSILSIAVAMRTSAWHLAWMAWRMEGDVAGEILRAIESTLVPNEPQALLLCVAAAWWQKHRQDAPLPKWIMRHATRISENKKQLTLTTVCHLANLCMLMNEPAFAIESTKLKTTPGTRKKSLRQMFTHLESPYEKFLHERETNDYTSNHPQRRSVEKLGRNEPCHCGSGSKYKECCEKADRKRLSRSSSVAGVTRDEISADPNADLTEARLNAMGPSDVLRLDPARVPEDLQKQYVFTLLVLQHYEEVMAAFRTFGVPERLHSVWSHAFAYATGAFRPEFARNLLEAFPDAEEKLGVKAHGGIRVLLVADDPAKFLETLEEQLRAAITSGDLEEFQKIASVVIETPYRALGIALTRSLLPIVEEKQVKEMFDDILNARAKLELSPDDEFASVVDERAARSGHGQESAAAQEAHDALAAKTEELRRAKEDYVRLEREAKLRDRRERKTEAEAKSAATPDDEARKKISELNRKLARANALVTEKAHECVALRRRGQALAKELEESESAKSQTEPEENEGEALEVHGTQPVRILKFPDNFVETLASFPRHVGRATMNRLGRIASGEPGAFKGVVKLKAYPSVLRARESDNHRLLFRLSASAVEVVDLILRRDLDRRVDRLVKTGQ